jgi:hypothetical protein
MNSYPTPTLTLLQLGLLLPPGFFSAFWPRLLQGRFLQGQERILMENLLR